VGRKLDKMLSLAGMLPVNPREFFARVAVLVEARLAATARNGVNVAAVEFGEAVNWVERTFGFNAVACMNEPALTALELEVARRLREVGPAAAIPLDYCADLWLARCCYLLCRARQAEVVIETGVGYGVTSAYLLQALEVNGGGRLLSIDLPPLGADVSKEVGLAVPERLRGRWRLEIGSSRSRLRAVAAQAGGVDMFVHDSLHTYRTVKWELETIAPHLKPGAVVVCDDIEGHRAFEEWLSSSQISGGLRIRAGNKAGKTFGLSLLRGAPEGGNGV